MKTARERAEEAVDAFKGGHINFSDAIDAVAKVILVDRAEVRRAVIVEILNVATSTHTPNDKLGGDIKTYCIDSVDLDAIAEGGEK